MKGKNILQLLKNDVLYKREAGGWEREVMVIGMGMFCYLINNFFDRKMGLEVGSYGSWNGLLLN
ncbi:hypothetical protein QWZ06_14810 [Chryseobacterium tructae]|uniref:hypothetical protein n=1 Tax=Chryseobacterium tructae TaxID=1037380 RepID=UPI0025B3AD59|nr:hypothetical protein [Chryseobacterium tructae]MDN3693461.1 hypothetical protein [Chryseobacterium tructae]